MDIKRIRLQMSTMDQGKMVKEVRAAKVRIKEAISPHAGHICQIMGEWVRKKEDIKPDITIAQITIVTITNRTITHGIRVRIGERMIGMHDTDMGVTIEDKRQVSRNVRE